MSVSAKCLPIFLFNDHKSGNFQEVLVEMKKFRNTLL